MSLVRHTFNDPFFSPDFHSSWMSPQWRPFDLFDSLVRQQESVFNAFDDVFNTPMITAPPVNFREEGNDYLVEVELPGVRREDLNVTVGDGGRSLTIDGRTFRRGAGSPEGESASISAHTEGEADALSSTPADTKQAKTGQVATTDSKQQQVIQSPNAKRESTFSSTFSRTFQFPRPVNGAGVKAHLEHGILSLRIPKMEDTRGMKVNID